MKQVISGEMQYFYSPNILFLIVILYTRYILFVNLFITFILFKNTKYFLSLGHKMKKLALADQELYFSFCRLCSKHILFQKDTKGEVPGDYPAAQEIMGARLVALAGTGAAAVARSEEVPSSLRPCSRILYSLSFCHCRIP